MGYRLRLSLLRFGWLETSLRDIPIKKARHRERKSEALWKLCSRYVDGGRIRVVPQHLRGRSAGN